MTGHDLWKTFLEAKIPSGYLTALGYDLYWTRARPSGDGVKAVNMLAEKLDLDPTFTYHAFNLDPGALLLRSLADDYSRHRQWEHVTKSTNIYVSRVAERMRIIKNGGSNPPPGGHVKAPAPAPAKAAAKAASHPTKAAAKSASPSVKFTAPLPPNPSKPIWPVALGASVLVFSLSLISQKGHREMSRRIEADHRLRLAEGRI